ncbi:MAG: phosphodiester glycosidase family protein [Rhodocyclaceae bacterium]
MRATLLAAVLLAACLTCAAADLPYTVVRVDVTSEKLQAFLGDEQGKPFKQFGPLSNWLHGKGKKLSFAMNAGMYHQGSLPVGLLVIDGKQVSPLNTSTGSGNFFLKPNGVFLLSSSGPKVVETGEYPSVAKDIILATQSGPLLLRDGVIHPEFNPASTSRRIRNGVGVSGSLALFVISEQPVTFYEFASFFRDVLHCKDALYFDGVVSSLYSIGLGRNDQRAELGPIVGVVIDQTSDPSIERISPGKPRDASRVKR